MPGQLGSTKHHDQCRSEIITAASDGMSILCGELVRCERDLCDKREVHTKKDKKYLMAVSPLLSMSLGLVIGHPGDWLQKET